MDADWDELRVISHVGPLPDGLPTPVSTLAFDTSQELLWVGSTYGRVRSFYGVELQQYTSWMGHRPEPVRQILFHDRGVISLSGRTLQMSKRTGLPIWRITDERFIDLYCMSFTHKTSNVLVVAGAQDIIFKIDVEKGQILDLIPAQDRYGLMKRAGQYICAANFSGQIHILDPSTLRVVKVWQAHLGQINDMDANSDFLVTCGLSQRQQHGLMPDPMANVFDLKTLSPLNPIPFQGGAAFVRMHPRMSTTSIVASQSGQLQVVDIMNPASATLKQAAIFDNNYLTGIELASTGEALALASSLCHIHLWGSPMRLKYAEYGLPTVFADPVPPTAPIDWSEETPLNTVGMPYYTERLFSYWPNQTYEVGLLPPKVDTETLANWKRSNEFGIYGPLPHGRQRNQIEYTRIEAQAHKSIAPPKFLSEKARDASFELEEDRGFSDALVDLKLDGAAKRDIPHIYRKVEIKYSRFGVDDFDFEFYNKTQYSGLETHIANSYANPLLQLYRFTPVLRNLTLYHTSTLCVSGDCMLCELGFLIDMLEKAAGLNCQATNFLKTFSGLPTAMQLNLLEEHAHNMALTMMIQSVNRLLLEKFVKDFRTVSPENPYFGHALETTVIATIRCAHCNHEQMRPEDPLCHNLAYPGKTALRHQTRGMPRVTFSQLLKASVERQDQMRGWCPSCRRYQQLHTTRQIRRVPAVLMINAAIHTVEAKQTWATPNWLPSEIGIIVDQGQFYCYQDQDLKLHLQRGVFNIQVYELVGVVAEVSSTQNERPHLVSHINVAASSPDVNAEDEWLLFNDFLVQPTPKDDALRFDPTWKLPSVLTYQLKSASHLIDDSWKENIDTSWLYTNILPERDEHPHQLTQLTKEEAPRPGTIMGIDAEFVSLQSEEIEFKADGTKETLRPSRLGLARVSVLRGEGPQAEIPFIDDYIVIKEPVVDYLTAFSGIRPGDLDPAISKHSLVSLKMAYKKLWLLLNLGCVFVGHGLLKDFRTINIHVPRGQVIDTVDLWYIKSRARKLNLRFLSWLLMRDDIQSGESHDSVEDARSALRLYRKYIEVQSQGKTEETLKWVYKRGQEVGYKAPAAAGLPAKSLAGPSSDAGTNGRNTPELPLGADEGVIVTPGRSRGFGGERIGGFGSPLR